MADPLRTPLRFTACALSVLGCACYGYRPVDMPTPGTQVRVGVPVQSALEGRRGAPQSASVDGTVVSAGDTLVLQASNTQQIDAFRTFTAVDTVRMAQDRLLSIEERYLSKPRTVAFSIASAVGVFLFVKGIQEIAGGSEDDGPPNGGGGSQSQSIVREIFRFALPLPGR
jgi:hypothetical protein